MTTAFQIGAFQFTGFQEQRVTGSGGLPPWLIKLLMERRQKKKAPQPEPIRQEEIVGAIAEIRARLSLRPAAPIPSPRVSLAPLEGAARARENAAELAEFRALLESTVVDWLDAA